MIKTVIALLEPYLLAKFVGNGVLGTKQRKAGLALLVLSSFLGVLALFFLILSYFYWLQTQFPPQTASFITALSVLALAAFAASAGIIVIRYKKKKILSRQRDLMGTVQVLLETIGDELDIPIRDHPKLSVFLAALGGYIIADKFGDILDSKN